jgi:hypothetical protein
MIDNEISRFYETRTFIAEFRHHRWTLPDVVTQSTCNLPDTQYEYLFMSTLMPFSHPWLVSQMVSLPSGSPAKMAYSFSVI